MFRIDELSFHLTGEEEERRNPPEGEDTSGATSRQQGLLCSCIPIPTAECEKSHGGDGEGEKDRQQELLRQRLRHEIGEARP